MSSVIKTFNQLENKEIQLLINRCPHLNFYCTSASIPGITTNAVRQLSPFADVKVTGDKPNFQPLIVNFLVDEMMENWWEIYEWIRDYSAPESFDDYKDDSVTQNNLYPSKKSPALLLVSNNKHNVSHEFTFIDLFPVDITDVIFDNQISDTQVLLATATFEYTVYSKKSFRS